MGGDSLNGTIGNWRMHHGTVQQQRATSIFCARHDLADDPEAESYFLARASENAFRSLAWPVGVSPNFSRLFFIRPGHIGHISAGYRNSGNPFAKTNRRSRNETATAFLLKSFPGFVGALQNNFAHKDLDHFQDTAVSPVLFAQFAFGSSISVSPASSSRRRCDRCGLGG